MKRKRLAKYLDDYCFRMIRRAAAKALP